MAWVFGAYRLDPDRFELTRGGEPVRLEPQVMALLIHLVRNNQRLVSKDEIVSSVWKGGIVSDASIASRVRSAREAVGDDGDKQSIIRTVHGRGYRFVAAVREEGASVSAPAEALAPSSLHELGPAVDRRPALPPAGRVA